MKRINNELTHGIHPYYAKFIPEIPRDFLTEYSKKGDYVLDPFCGSGTTLLEAMLCERHSVGVDMSYIAYIISKAKVTIPNIEVIDKYYQKIISFIESNEKVNPINFENKSIWFTKETNDILDKILHSINSINKIEYRCIFLVLFSSILKTVSNKRKVWNNGYIADNVLPNVDYSGDVLNVFKNKFKQIRESYIELIDKCKTSDFCPQVINSSIEKYNSNRKFDIVITSPPYPFAVDFVRYYRLSYYWFDKNIDEFTKMETGARKKRSSKNAVENFYNEMERIYLHIFNLTKQNGYFCMTVADTQRKKEKINFIDWLYDIFLRNGWVLVSDKKRKIESQSMGQKRIPYEHKIVFKKVKKI